MEKPAPDSPEVEKDYTRAAMLILTELADEGRLFPMVDFIAEMNGEEQDGKLGRKRRERKRWPSYEANCYAKIRKAGDAAAVLWAGTLVLIWYRATEGGRRTTVYLRHGHKRPDKRVSFATVDLLRQSGLKAYIRRHQDDATVISVSF